MAENYFLTEITPPKASQAKLVLYQEKNISGKLRYRRNQDFPVFEGPADGDLFEQSMFEIYMVNDLAYLHGFRWIWPSKES